MAFGYSIKSRVWIFLAFGFLAIPAMVRAQARNCDFSGNAKVRGVNVKSSNVITAYDQGGQLCGSTYGYSGGGYLIHVTGDDPGTSGEDEGAPEGGRIIFRIDGERAFVTSGDSIFNNMGYYDTNIEVPEVPPVAVTGGPYSGSEGTTVNFNGSGSTGAVSYAWTFGDGGTGTGSNPTHTYTDNATYTVTLTVYNGSGQSDTESTTAVISNVVPTVASMSNKTSNEGESVSFSGSATDPAGANDPLIYNWTFGDGGTATGQNVNHTYVDDRATPYTVTLTVTDGDGGSGSKTLTVTVSNIAPQNVNAGDDKASDEGQSVSFTGNATDPAGTYDPLVYTWNFGDSQTGTGKTISHVFRDNGTFNVVLTVSDGDGGSSTDNVSAVVSNVAPTAHTGGPYTAIIDQSLQLNGSGTDPGSLDALTYEWDLDNDGSYDDATGRYPQKTWTEEGVFPISLKVSDDDAGWDTDNTTVHVIQLIAVHLQTSPGTTLQLTFDGQTVTCPYTAYLVPGTTHSVEAPRFQAISADTRYEYVNWSDGGNRAHSIHVGAATLTLTANYEFEYWVEIDEKGLGNASGEGWYNRGDKATVSIDTLVEDAQGTTQHLFQSWIGTGSGSYTGTVNPAQFFVNGPIVERVNWSSKYRLRVITSHGTATGPGWYAEGSWATIRIDTLVDESSGSRFRFDSWQGTGSGSYTGTANPVSVQMNAPVAETVNWITQYFLDAVSDYGTPMGEGWYNSGAPVTISIDTAIAVSDSVRHHFLGWVGTGPGSYTGDDPSPDIVISGPIREESQWNTQYYLWIEVDPPGSGYVTPVSFPGGWGNAGQALQVTAIGYADSGYCFFNWSGDDQGNSNPLNFNLDSPKHLTAHFIRGLVIFCDFWGEEPDVLLPDDTLRTFDPQGVMCGETMVQTGGCFILHTVGDKKWTSNADEGAAEGDSIRFAVNGRSLLIRGGNPVWHAWGNEEVHLAVQFACNFFGAQPDVMLAGDVLRAYDPDDVLCGETLVLSGGKFLVSVSGDDPQTHSVDEGALNGDTIRFEVDGDRMVVTGGNPVWINWGNREIGLGFDQVGVNVSGTTNAFKHPGLFQNYPNPFNGKTVIGFALPDADPVTVQIFDASGRLVRTLADKIVHAAGTHAVTWNGRDDANLLVNSGLYFCKVQIGDRWFVRKMVLMN